MKILAIETSCDETAIAILNFKDTAKQSDAEASISAPISVSILSHAIITQEIHREYGGVFPIMAKREHANNLPLLLGKALAEAFPDVYDAKTVITSIQDSSTAPATSPIADQNTIKEALAREPGLYEASLGIWQGKLARPTNIEAIVVTEGPGLEPALWVGVNFARALGLIWNIPVVPAHHMEGHILASLLQKENKPTSSTITATTAAAQITVAPTFTLNTALPFPAIALLVSGGHTELVLMRSWRSYEVIGRTRDDAAGECFDKVARILGLPYPGGPEVSRRAETIRSGEQIADRTIFAGLAGNALPRPMIHSKDFDFSFSGLKTAVLYLVRDLTLKDANKTLSKQTIATICAETEDAIIDVLIAKAAAAIEHYGAQSFIIGGGVIANKVLRARAEKLAAEHSIILATPEVQLSTDNAVMIGLAGFVALKENPETAVRAPEVRGNVSIGNQ